MITKGIQIKDKINGVIYVTLTDILQEVYSGDLFYWSILYIKAIGNLGEGKSIIEFEKEINDSENGLSIQWADINNLSNKFDQVIDLILIGCKDKTLLHCYSSDQEMSESCDIVIQMIDSWFWEIFSKDEGLIKRLENKFIDSKLVMSDYKR